MMYWKKRNKRYFNVDSNSTNSKIIGVVGTGRGVGVTHFCILLAEYIAMDKGSFVAILECNNHGDFKWMEEHLLEDETYSYSFHKVDYYGGVDMNCLDAILQKKYAYLILDFGDQLSGKEKALRLCQKKILLGVEAWWKKNVVKEKMLYFSSQGFDCFYNLNEQGIPFTRLIQRPEKKIQNIFEKILNF